MRIVMSHAENPTWKGWKGGAIGVVSIQTRHHRCGTIATHHYSIRAIGITSVRNVKIIVTGGEHGIWISKCMPHTHMHVYVCGATQKLQNGYQVAAQSKNIGRASAGNDTPRGCLRLASPLLNFRLKGDLVILVECVLFILIGICLALSLPLRPKGF